jgi:ferredoxin
MRGWLSPGDHAPSLNDGRMARTLVLIGHAGGTMWPPFEAWRRTRPDHGGKHPLDGFSKSVILPVARGLGGTAYFPSDRPWQPFQQWAMAAEGLQASPLGILIHPDFGLWHGYRGAIGFAEALDLPKPHIRPSPCLACDAKPCLSSCPAGAVSGDGFSLAACRSHLASAEGGRGCMQAGCLARAACPVGEDYRYPSAQLKFHMDALEI